MAVGTERSNLVTSAVHRHSLDRKVGHRLTMYMHSTKSNRSKYVNCSLIKLTGQRQLFLSSGDNYNLAVAQG